MQRKGSIRSFKNAAAAVSMSKKLQDAMKAHKEESEETEEKPEPPPQPSGTHYRRVQDDPEATLEALRLEPKARSPEQNAILAMWASKRLKLNTSVEWRNLAKVMLLEEREPEDLIFSQGDEGDAFYVIFDGEVDLFVQTGEKPDDVESADDGALLERPQALDVQEEPSSPDGSARLGARAAEEGEAGHGPANGEAEGTTPPSGGTLDERLAASAAAASTLTEARSAASCGNLDENSVGGGGGDRASGGGSRDGSFRSEGAAAEEAGGRTDGTSVDTGGTPSAVTGEAVTGGKCRLAALTRCMREGGAAATAATEAGASGDGPPPPQYIKRKLSMSAVTARPALETVETVGPRPPHQYILRLRPALIDALPF